MADEIKITGKTVLTVIKRDAWTDFRTVSCSTGDTFTGATNTTSSTDKCSDGWEENYITGKSWEVGLNGKAIKIDDSGDPAPSQASAKLLAQLWQSGEEFDVRMANADNSFYVDGRAIITNYSATAPDDGTPVTFTATLKGQGKANVDEPETT